MTTENIKHCDTCICGRRAPVQSSQQRDVSCTYREQLKGIADHGPGTISWSEYLIAYSDYSAHYGTQQSAERLAERGGFSYFELVMHLRREPTTWEPRR